MKINMMYFARSRECLGIDQEIFEVAPGDTVADVVDALAGRGSIWQQLFDGDARVMAAINEQLVAQTGVLNDGDTLALFPPVSGG